MQQPFMYVKTVMSPVTFLFSRLNNPYFFQYFPTVWGFLELITPAE